MTTYRCEDCREVYIWDGTRGPTRRFCDGCRRARKRQLDRDYARRHYVTIRERSRETMRHLNIDSAARALPPGNDFTVSINDSGVVEVRPKLPCDPREFLQWVNDGLNAHWHHCRESAS